MDVADAIRGGERVCTHLASDDGPRVLAKTVKMAVALGVEAEIDLFYGGATPSTPTCGCTASSAIGGGGRTPGPPRRRLGTEPLDVVGIRA